MIYCLRSTEEVGVDSTYHLSTCLRPIYIADARQALEVFLGAVDGIHCESLIVWVLLRGTVILQEEVKSYIRLEGTINLLASLSFTSWGRSLYSNSF